MADQSRLEVGQYDTQLMGGTPSLLAVVQAIRAAALTDLPPWALAALDNLLVKAAALDAEWKKTPQASRPIRPVDARVDYAWINIHDRLLPWTRMPASEPLAAPGNALFQLCFPGGNRAFLGIAYVAEWAESQKRIEQIQSGHLLDVVKACVGEPFWNELLAAHADYGDVLGLTRSKPQVDAIQLLEKQTDLRLAIANYGSTLAVYGNNDPAKLDAVRRALRPIDEARATIAAAHAVTATAAPVSVPAPSPA